MDRCELRAANGSHGVDCDGERCVYWRVVEQLDLGVEPEAGSGCAIQYFELLDDENDGVATWLLSVKERVEGRAGRHQDPAGGSDVR